MAGVEGADDEEPLLPLDDGVALPVDEGLLLDEGELLLDEGELLLDEGELLLDEGELGLLLVSVEGVVLPDEVGMLLVSLDEGSVLELPADDGEVAASEADEPELDDELPEAPVDPLAPVDELEAPPSAALVCASKLPEAPRPCADWNWRSAAWVFEPILPSIAPGS